MALRWFATSSIHFNNVRAFNRGNYVPASIVEAHDLDGQGLVVQIDVDVDDPAVVLRPILTSDFDTDTEREKFVPARLSEVALRGAFGLAFPAYAGTRAKTWDGQLKLYNGESPTLRTMRQKIRHARAGATAAKMVCFGDSRTWGSGLVPAEAVALDSYPAQLSSLLGGVPGLIYADQSDKRWTTMTNFTLSGLDSHYSLASATGGTATLTLTEPCTGLRLWGYYSPGGTATVTVDGGTPVTWTIPGGAVWKYQDITGLTNAAHTITITTTVGMALLGVEPLHTTPKLRISNAGRPSSDASFWKPINWLNLYGSAFGVGNGGNAGFLKPDLAIMNLGTNNGASTLADLETVATEITTLGVPLLLVVFGPRSDDGAHYDAKRSKLYDIADTLNLPLVDFTQVLGGSYAAANAAGLMADTVHESSSGYAREAAALARVLVPR